MAEGNGLELLESDEFDGEQGNDHVVKVEDGGRKMHVRVERLVFDDPKDQIETVFELVGLTMGIGSRKGECGRLGVNGELW